VPFIDESSDAYIDGPLLMTDEVIKAYDRSYPVAATPSAPVKKQRRIERLSATAVGQLEQMRSCGQHMALAVSGSYSHQRSVVLSRQRVSATLTCI